MWCSNWRGWKCGLEHYKNRRVSCKLNSIFVSYYYKWRNTGTLLDFNSMGKGQCNKREFLAFWKYRPFQTADRQEAGAGYWTGLYRPLYLVQLVTPIGPTHATMLKSLLRAIKRVQHGVGLSHSVQLGISMCKHVRCVSPFGSCASSLPLRFLVQWHATQVKLGVASCSQVEMGHKVAHSHPPLYPWSNMRKICT